MKYGNLLKLLLTTLPLIVGNAQAAIQLGFGTPNQSSNLLDLPLVVSGLSEHTTPALSSYDLAIDFDGNRLVFAGASFGDPILGNQLDLFNLGLNPGAAEITANGALNLYQLSLDSSQDLNALQADSFTLATLHFTVLQAGNSQMAINVLAFGDSDGNPLSPSVSAATIATVPLPATAWLMLGGLGILLRRQTKGMVSCRITL